MGRAVRTQFFKATAFVVGIGLAGVFPARVDAENLADALVGAYNTSGILEQNRALLRATDENVALAVSALRPILTWTATMGRTLTESRTGTVSASTQTTPYGIGLNAQVLLYDGGAAAMGVLGTKESVLATRQALISIEQAVLMRAVTAYLDVNAQTQNVALRENNLGLLNEELKASRDRFEVGEVTRTDVALAESQVAQARSELAVARGFLDNSKAEYLSAVGHRPDQLEPLPPLPSRPATVAQAQTLAVQNHPDILSVQHQVVVAEITIEQLKRQLRPTVTLGAGIGVTENYGLPDYRNSANVSIDLNQTIYQGGALSSRIRAAIAQRDAARGNLLTVQRNVVQEANNAFVRVDVAIASLAATKERIRAAEVAFYGIREEATLGARTTLDVLTAEQELLNANTAQITANAERSEAAYRLLQAQGLLTAERLGLNVLIYDPTVYYNLAKNAPVGMSKQGKDLDRVLEALGKQ